MVVVTVDIDNLPPYVKNYFLSCDYPPVVETIARRKEGNVEFTVWRWTWGGVTVYGINALVTENNHVIRFTARTLRQEDVEKWLKALDRLAEAINALVTG